MLWVYDQDAWAQGLDYSQVPLDISRRVYESVRAAIIYYAGRYYEQQGHLEFVHRVTGVRTLKDEFDKVASHNEHHLGQIRLALHAATISDGSTHAFDSRERHDRHSKECGSGCRSDVGDYQRRRARLSRSDTG